MVQNWHSHAGPTADCHIQPCSGSPQLLYTYNIKLKLCAKRVLAVKEWFWWSYATLFMSISESGTFSLGLINMSYSVIECFLEEKKLCQLIWEYSTPALLLEGFRWTRVLEGGWKGLWPDCSPCNFHRNVIYTKRIFSLPPSTIFVRMNSLF